MIIVEPFLEQCVSFLRRGHASKAAAALKRATCQQPCTPASPSRKLQTTVTVAQSKTSPQWQQTTDCDSVSTPLLRFPLLCR